MRLDGKVAVVTGSSRGIGKATALRMAKEGARVVVHGKRDQGRLGPIVDEITQGRGEAIAVAADVGDEREVDRLFDETLKAFGTVDVLVNNAAWSDPKGHLLEMGPSLWDEVIRSNLRSVYLTTHRFANILVDRGKAGSVVNLTSFGGARAKLQTIRNDPSMNHPIRAQRHGDRFWPGSGSSKPRALVQNVAT